MKPVRQKSISSRTKTSFGLFDVLVLSPLRRTEYEYDEIRCEVDQVVCLTEHPGTGPEFMSQVHGSTELVPLGGLEPPSLRFVS